MQRRTLLKGLATSGLLIGANPYSMVWANDHSQYDVIVIGAGLSGLASANYLNNLGCRVLVLEARERIGGRIFTVQSPVGTSELGGMQIGQGYGLMRTYVAQHNLSLERLSGYATQTHFYIDEQRIAPNQWPSHKANQLSAGERDILPSHLYYRAMSKGVKFAQPSDWTKPEYAHLDIPLYDYLKQQGVSNEGLRLIDANINALSARDVSAADALYRVSLARSGGQGADRVKGGNSRFTEALADPLKNQIQTQKVVTEIDQSGSNVVIRCEDGSRYHAKRAIITTPFSTLKDVAIKGTLSSGKRHAINNAVYTPVSQVHFALKAGADVSALEAVNLWADNPLGRVFTQVDEQGYISQLTCWANGLQAKQLDTLSTKEATDTVTRRLEAAYPGLKGKVEPIIHQSWANERFSKGAYIQFAPGQVQRMVHHMANAEDKLHFAGEHTEFTYSGMESALVSGLRAAQEASYGL